MRSASAGPIGVGEDRIVIVKVLEHRKPAPRPVAEVRDEIVAAIRKERGSRGRRRRLRMRRAPNCSPAHRSTTWRRVSASRAEPARFIGRDDPSTPAADPQARIRRAKPGRQARLSLGAAR